MSEEAAAVRERHLHVPVWDDITDDYRNCWMTYRPADPFYVRVEIEGYDTPLDVPRAVLLAGLKQLAVCITSKPDAAIVSTLRACPSTQAAFAMWTITQDGQEKARFRVLAELLTQHLGAMYDLVPLGAEGERIDWDGDFKALLGGDS